MKKILVLIALILCFSMVLTSCDFVAGVIGGKDDVEDNAGDDEKEERVDNVEANIAMLVKLFNTYENADQIYEDVKGLTEKEVEIDLNKIANDLKKYEAQGSTSLSAWEDGEKLENDVDLSLALKDNNIQLSGLMDGVDGGMHAYISDDLKVVFAVWDEEDGEIDVNNSVAFDIDDIKDEYMDMMEDYVEQMADVEIPLELKEIILGGIKTADIEYKDGKYVLSTDAIYNSIVNTIDSLIDAAANNEEIPVDDIAEQYKTIKETAKKVLDAIDLEIYFLVKYETIEGLGMSIDVKAAEVLKAMDMEDVDLDEVADGLEYIQAAFEFSTKGESVHFEFKQNDRVNKVNGKVEFITKGDKLTGVEMAYEMDVETASEYTSEEKNYVDDQVIVETTNHRSENYIKADMTANVTVIYDGDEVCGLTVAYDMDAEDISKSYENGVLTSDSYSNVEMEASMTLNAANFEKENSTVLDMSFKMNSDSAHAYKDMYSSSNKDDIEVTASIKTTDANEADVVVEASNKSVHTNNGQTEEYNDSIKVEGTFDFTTKDVKAPSLNADVKDAMEDAEDDPMDPSELFDDNNKAEAPIDTPEYDYDYDYDYDYNY